MFQVLFQPCHLRLGDFGGVVGRAGVEHVVEHDEVAVADVVRIIGGAERRTETVVGLRVHADGLVVVVVADHLEDGYADLPDLLLVDAVERHVVPHQVAQRNAVDRFVQLLYVGHQQGQHLFFEHHDLVVAADLHVGQRQQGEPLLFAGAFERETALHNVVVAQGDLLIDLRHAVLHRDLAVGGHRDEHERSALLHAHLVDPLRIGGRYGEAVAHNRAFDRILAVGHAAHEVHAGFGGDVNLFVKAAEYLGAFVFGAGREPSGEQDYQQVFEQVFDHCSVFLFGL